VLWHIIGSPEDRVPPSHLRSWEPVCSPQLALFLAVVSLDGLLPLYLYQVLGNSMRRLHVSKTSYFWDTRVAMLWLRSATQPRAHADLPEAPRTCRTSWDVLWHPGAPNLHQRAQPISTGHSQWGPSSNSPPRVLCPPGSPCSHIKSTPSSQGLL